MDEPNSQYSCSGDCRDSIPSYGQDQVQVILLLVRLSRPREMGHLRRVGVPALTVRRESGLPRG